MTCRAYLIDLLTRHPYITACSLTELHELAPGWTRPTVARAVRSIPGLHLEPYGVDAWVCGKHPRELMVSGQVEVEAQS